MSNWLVRTTPTDPLRPCARHLVGKWQSQKLSCRSRITEGLVKQGGHPTSYTMGFRTPINGFFLAGTWAYHRDKKQLHSQLAFGAKTDFFCPIKLGSGGPWNLNRRICKKISYPPWFGTKTYPKMVCYSSLKFGVKPHRIQVYLPKNWVDFLWPVDQVWISWWRIVQVKLLMQKSSLQALT